jgi:NAD(P)-dependent dehydrogenase (short-subunit alcohol dehydrogenase family)
MFLSPTKTYHSNSYLAIDPTLPALSSKGRNVVITGGGSGIGPVIARSFAKSGASSVSILGRTLETLEETKNSLAKDYPKTKFFSYIADIVDEKALAIAFNAVKAAVGLVDVLIANAGYLPDISPIMGSEPEEWFSGFTVNVKGNFNLVRAFVPVAVQSAVIINISTAVTHLPFLPGYSRYQSSKLAAAKFFDYVHQEFPDYFVLNVHPGVIRTAMDDKTVASGTVLPYDNGMLSSKSCICCKGNLQWLQLSFQHHLWCGRQRRSKVLKWEIRLGALGRE